MKTSLTSIDRTVTKSQAQVRFVLVIAGIAVAILCTIALWQDASSSVSMKGEFHLPGTPRAVAYNINR